MDRDRESPVRLLPRRINEAASQIVCLARVDRSPPLGGTIRGPRCAYARTVEATHRLSQESSPTHAIVWSTWIEESCLWEPAHPFLYDVRIEAEAAPGASSLFNRAIGLRSLTLRAEGPRLNGRPWTPRGIVAPIGNEDTLRSWHAMGIDLVFPDTIDNDAIDRASTFGPFVMARLPDDERLARDRVESSVLARPSVGLWIVPASWDRDADRGLRLLDPTTLFARHVNLGEWPPADDDALAIVRGTRSELSRLAAGERIRWIGQVIEDVGMETRQSWDQLRSDLDAALLARAGCVGWIAGGGALA